MFPAKVTDYHHDLGRCGDQVANVHLLVRSVYIQQMNVDRLFDVGLVLVCRRATAIWRTLCPPSWRRHSPGSVLPRLPSEPSSLCPAHQPLHPCPHHMLADNVLYACESKAEAGKDASSSCRELCHNAKS